MGREILSSKKVRLKDVTSHMLVGVVTDGVTPTKEVIIGLLDEKIVSKCSCESEQDCEHVIALALAALLIEEGDNEGYLEGSRAVLRRAFVGTKTSTMKSQSKKTVATTRIPSLKSRYPWLPVRLCRQLPPDLELAKDCELIMQNLIKIWNGKCRGWPIEWRAAISVFGDSRHRLSRNVGPLFSVENLYDFCCFAALIARDHEIEIPKNLSFLTERPDLKEQLDTLKIQKKLDGLSSLLKTDIELARNQALTPIKIRLRVDKDGFCLVWKKATKGEFTPIPNGVVYKLAGDSYRGREQFSLLSLEERKFEELFNADQYNSTAAFEILRENAPTFIHSVLKNQREDDILLTANGTKFIREPTPLRAQISEIDNSDGGDKFYQLELVEGSSGNPVSGIIFFSNNDSTTFILTENKIYSTGFWPCSVLNPGVKHKLPQGFFETEQGMFLLVRLNLTLPGEKTLFHQLIATQEQPFKLQVEVSLPDDASFEVGEELFFKFRALGDSGSFVLKEDSWILEHQPKTGMQSENEGSIDELVAFLSPNALPDVGQYMGALSLRWNEKYGVFSTKIYGTTTSKFIEWIESLPPGSELLLDRDLQDFKARKIVSAEWSIQVNPIRTDWFDLMSVVSVEQTLLTKEELRLLLRSVGKYIHLPGKGFIKLEISIDNPELVRTLGLRLPSSGEEKISAHVLQLEPESLEGEVSSSIIENLRLRRRELALPVKPPLPKSITATLRPYQVEGYYFLNFLSNNNLGGILADDMGLGKTIQTLAWIDYLRSRNELKKEKILVVCPKSVVDNWLNDSAKFTPQLRIGRFQSDQDFQDVLTASELIVMNYTQLRIHGEKIRKVRFKGVILDEGQYIKNPLSQTALVARWLDAQHRLILSGTPVENRPLDLWSLMEFAMPGLLGPRKEFSKCYNGDLNESLVDLSKRVRPFILRRTKELVAPDLPEKSEEDVFVELEGTQKTLYQAELKHAQQVLLHIKGRQKKLDSVNFEVLTALLRLRQAALHPALLDQKQENSAKVEVLLERLEPLIDSGKKVLVFTQFVEFIKIIKPILIKRGWPIEILTGATENRAQVVDRFQNCSGACVFLISLKAGGFGLNLTAAQYVFLLDPWWNPAVEAQAIDRTHRIGQKEKVTAYRLIARGTIEEKIRMLQTHKQEIANAIFDHKELSQKLSVDDFEYLLDEGTE